MPQPTVDPERTARGPWSRPLTIGFALVVVIVLWLLYRIYRPLAHPLLWAVALATLVYPAHVRVVRWVGGRATLAALLSTIVWIAVIVVPGILVVNQLVHEARDLWPRLSAPLTPTLFQKAADWVHESPVRRLVHLLFELPDTASAAALEERFKAGVDSLAAFMVTALRQFTLGAPGTIVRISATVVAFFFFLRQGPRWLAGLREVLPLQAGLSSTLFDTVALSIKTVFRGVLLTAAAQASLATAGYVIAGAPVPVLLGFLTFITSLLPFVGAAAVWVPTALGLFLVDRTGSAIFLTLYGTLVVSLVDNFLRPLLIGQGMQLPLLWLFLAILGGLQSFGFLGLLLGPATLALTLACVRIYMQGRRIDPGRDSGGTSE
jgi:predicted PurR-regulated permease PerM